MWLAAPATFATDGPNPCTFELMGPHLQIIPAPGLVSEHRPKRPGETSRPVSLGLGFCSPNPRNRKTPGPPFHTARLSFFDPVGNPSGVSPPWLVRFDEVVTFAWMYHARKGLFSELRVIATASTPCFPRRCSVLSPT